MAYGASPPQCPSGSVRPRWFTWRATARWYAVAAITRPKVDKMDNTYVKGNYRSAEGVEGKEVWGTRCRWMKLGSEINGEKVSLVIIDHPDNVGYPTYWHARDYGLFAANTLGQKIFSNGEKELNFSLNKGETATFRYRLVVASEDLSDEEINKLADEYAKKKS